MHCSLYVHNAVALWYFCNISHEKCTVSHRRQLTLQLALLIVRLCTSILSLMFENLLVSVELGWLYKPCGNRKHLKSVFLFVLKRMRFNWNVLPRKTKQQVSVSFFHYYLPDVVEAPSIFQIHSVLLDCNIPLFSGLTYKISVSKHVGLSCVSSPYI